MNLPSFIENYETCMQKFARLDKKSLNFIEIFVIKSLKIDFSTIFHQKFLEFLLLLLKSIPLENNTSFQQQFFRFLGWMFRHSPSPFRHVWEAFSSVLWGSFHGPLCSQPRPKRCPGRAGRGSPLDTWTLSRHESSIISYSMRHNVRPRKSAIYLGDLARPLK